MGRNIREAKNKSMFSVIVNDKFVKQLTYLSEKIYGVDHSLTLTLIIREVCGDDKKYDDFMNYFIANANTIKTMGVTQTSIQKSYNIGMNEYKLMKKKRGEFRLASFIRALVSYVYNFHIRLISKGKLYEIIDKAEKATGLKVLDTIFIGGNMQVIFDISPIVKEEFKMGNVKLGIDKSSIDEAFADDKLVRKKAPPEQE